MATMKIRFNDFKVFIKKNMGSLPLILIYGSNQLEIKSKSREAITLICGPSGVEEMRVSTFTETELLKDPTIFYSKLKTVGFFPGKQVLTIESATDKIVKILTDALKSYSNDDPTILITSNALKVTSSLRKLAEEHQKALCLPIYDEQRDKEKFELRVNSSSLNIDDNKISSFLKDSRNFSSVNSFMSFMENLELYKFCDPSPVSFKEIEILLSEVSNPTIHDMINYLANGDTKNTIFLLQSLFNVGVTTNQIIILTNKHFSLLHKLSLHKNNPNIILNKTYPPLYGHRREQIIQHSNIWSTKLTERALQIILRLEEKLRTPSKVPLRSILERSFLRISSFINKQV